MAFPTTVDLSYGAVKKVGTVKYRPLETRGVTPNGNVYYYCRNGATALDANRLVQAKAPETGALALTPATNAGDWTTNPAGIATGKRNIGVVWATIHSSGEFVDGYMTVETTPGGGQYRVVEDPGRGATVGST